jgi:hypothetical protein
LRSVLLALPLQAALQSLRELLLQALPAVPRRSNLTRQQLWLLQLLLLVVAQQPHLDEAALPLPLLLLRVEWQSPAEVQVASQATGLVE